MRALWPFLLLGILLPVGPACAELGISAIRTHQSAQTVLLDVELQIDDSEREIPRALLRGDIWLAVEITLTQKLYLFGSRPAGRLHVLRRLSYDPLHNVYRITRVNQDTRQDFSSLAPALSRLQVLEAVPVTRLDWLLPQRDRYRGRIQARLYANPMPMEPALGVARSQPLDWQSGVAQWHLP